MSEFPEWIEDRLGLSGLEYEDSLEIHRALMAGHTQTCRGWHGNPPKMDNSTCSCGANRSDTDPPSGAREPVRA